MTEELKAAKAAEAAEAAEVERLRVMLAKAYLCLSRSGKECIDGTVIYRGTGGEWRFAGPSALKLIGYDIQVAADELLPHYNTLIIGHE